MTATDPGALANADTQEMAFRRFAEASADLAHAAPDRRLYDDDGTPIRRPGHDQPVHVSPESGRRETPAEHAPPATAPPEPLPPGYTRTSTGRILAGIDGALYESAWQDNARLRRERDAALADAATERCARRDALARLAQVETELAALRAERAALRAERAEDRDRIAELVLTLRALGEKTDPAGHESAASGEEGGE